MDRNLIEAWEAIEAKERLDEKRKVTAVKTNLRKPTTAVKGKKLDEDGVGGANGTGVGPSSYANQAGKTMTQSGAAAVVPTKQGKKPSQVKEAIADDAKAVAANSVRNMKQGKGTTVDASLVGQMATEEQLPETPLPPGAEEVGAEVSAEVDPHAEGPEAAAAAHDANPAAEEAAEDVSVDAETAEQVINAIQKQYPGAVITLSVQLPEGTPFEPELVAAAQEITGDEAPVEGGLEGDAEVAPEGDVEAPVEPEAGAEAPADDEAKLLENRKVAVRKARKQIKELFARMGEEAPEVPVEPEAGEDVAPPAEGEGAEADVAAPEAAVEVSDTKIALSPEQWGQVLATTDLLGDDAEGAGGAEGAAPAASDDEAILQDAGVDAGEEPEQVDELKTKVNFDPATDKMEILKSIEQGDIATDKSEPQDVPIVPANKPKDKIQESFNHELAEYARTLEKMRS